MEFFIGRTGQDMELWPEANDIVHQFMPCVMDAANLPQMAELFRRLPEVSNSQSLAEATELLAESQTFEAGEWTEIVRESAFWASAAIWSAIRGDRNSFRDHLMKLRKTFSSFPSEETMH